MAGKEEENYLDKLLDSVGAEGLDTEESKSISGDRDDSDYDKPEVSEYIISQKDVEDVMSEIAVTDEMAQKIENTEQYEKAEVPQSNEAANDTKISASDRTPDFSEPELSEGDLVRLADMELDTIIEDVSSDTLSVEDLFGEGGVGDIELDPLPSQVASEQNGADVKIEKASKAGNESAVRENSEEIVNETFNTQAETSLPQNLESAEAAAAAAAVGDVTSMKKNQGKIKKSIGQFIKNIFFESTEETPESSKAKKEAKKAGTEAERNVQESVKHEINSEEDSVEELDENQRLIYEMYGDGSNTEETAAPKKGFFSKIKYRLQQTIKKNQEEDKLEQEAEDKENEERKKIKAEKKEAGKVKRDEVKKAKKAKQESRIAKKAAKPKKVKKPKPQPKPGDILKIRPQSVVLFVLFVAGAIILISMLNSALSYNKSLSAAKYNMENGNYSGAYEALSGLKLHKEDKNLYNQASAIMYVQRQYESYENYSSIGMHTEAINALIKGLERYNLYYNKAVELGVNKQVDNVRAEIVKKLEEDYKISETEAKELLVMSEENFTQYYSKIEAYGEAKNDSNN